MNTVLLAILDNNVENYPHALEQQFPRILDKIMSLWDTPEIDNYFSELMVSKRIKRQGFPAEIASDIIYLSVVHSRQHGPVSMGNPWDELPEHFRQQIEMQGAPFSRKDFIFHLKVKTTGFSRLALAAIMRFLNGGGHGLQARKPYSISN